MALKLLCKVGDLARRQDDTSVPELYFNEAQRFLEEGTTLQALQ